MSLLAQITSSSRDTSTRGMVGRAAGAAVGAGILTAAVLFVGAAPATADTKPKPTPTTSSTIPGLPSIPVLGGSTIPIPDLGSLLGGGSGNDGSSSSDPTTLLNLGQYTKDFDLSFLPGLGSIPGVNLLPEISNLDLGLGGLSTGSLPGLGSLPSLGSLPGLGTGSGGSTAPSLPGLPSVPGLSTVTGLLPGASTVSGSRAASTAGHATSSKSSEKNGAQNTTNAIAAHKLVASNGTSASDAGERANVIGSVGFGMFVAVLGGMAMIRRRRRFNSPSTSIASA